MSINIVDNFNVNVSKPIDARMVVANLAARNAITYKYDGLKVFQQDDRKTYIWNSTSSNWSFDNDSLSDGYVPKFTPIGFTNSAIYSTASRISINTYIGSPSLSTMEVLQLNNPSGYGIGFGEPLTFHFSSESIIGYNWYYSGSEQRFNTGKGSSAIRFSDDGSILFSPHTGAPNVFLSSMMKLDPSTGVVINYPIINSNFLSFVNTNEAFRVSNDRIRLADGTSALPILSFSSSTGTGIYSPSLNSLGISVNGWSAAFMSQTDVSLAVAGATGLSLTPTNSILSYGGNTVSVSSAWISLKIAGSTPGYPALFPEKIIVSANDIFANVHQQGVSGIGDSGNTLYAPDGSGGGVGPWNYPTISSGLFAGLTITDKVNITTAVASPAQWIRVGNIVNVTGHLTVDITTANILTEFSLSLPINTYFGDNNYWQLGGVGRVINSTSGQNIGGGDVIAIYAGGVSTGRNKARFRFWPSTNTTNRNISYSFQYIVASYINSPPPFGMPGPSPAPAPPPP